MAAIGRTRVTPGMREFSSACCFTFKCARRSSSKAMFKCARECVARTPQSRERRVDASSCSLSRGFPKEENRNTSEPQAADGTVCAAWATTCAPVLPSGVTSTGCNYATSRASSLGFASRNDSKLPSRRFRRSSGSELTKLREASVSNVIQTFGEALTGEVGVEKLADVDQQVATFAMGHHTSGPLRHAFNSRDSHPSARRNPRASGCLLADSRMVSHEAEKLPLLNLEWVMRPEVARFSR